MLLSLESSSGNRPVNGLDEMSLQTRQHNTREINRIKIQEAQYLARHKQNRIDAGFRNRTVNKNWSYSLSKLVRFPSSGGTGPENWFASMFLERPIFYDNLTENPSKQFIKNKVWIWTYRSVREVMFPSSLGIVPDKRFPNRETCRK